MVDHMLLKLGKSLRILGYDAAWDLAARTHDLITRANAEGRIFVTRNTRIPCEYPPTDKLLTVKATDPVEQLLQVARDCRLEMTAGLFSRCIRCNVPLTEIDDKTTVKELVHPNVFARFDQFYTCPECGTVFWKGSHVKNTMAKLGLPHAY